MPRRRVDVTRNTPRLREDYMRQQGAPTKKTPKVVAALAALCLGSVACGSGGGGGEVAASASEQQRALWEEAKATNNGQLTVFVGSSGTSQLDRVGEAFAADYPGVNLQWISGTSDTVQERFLTERRAGLSNADVLALVDVEPYRRLADEGYLEEFTPESADKFDYDEKAFIPNTAYAFADIPMGACYNPNNVTEDEVELLKTYEGWVDPVWNGRSAIINDEGYSTRRSLTYWVYEDPSLGVPWLEGLAAHQPVAFKSSNTAAPQVIAGEYDVLFNSQTMQAPRAAVNGAPLRCVTAEYAPAYLFVTALARDAPNTAAGKLFINWIMSENGQRTVQEAFGFNARLKGFDEPVLEEEWWEVPTDLRFADPKIVTDRYEELSATFNQLFGSPS